MYTAQPSFNVEEDGLLADQWMVGPPLVGGVPRFARRKYARNPSPTSSTLPLPSEVPLEAQKANTSKQMQPPPPLSTTAPPPGTLALARPVPVTVCAGSFSIRPSDESHQQRQDITTYPGANLKSGGYFGCKDAAGTQRASLDSSVIPAAAMVLPVSRAQSLAPHGPATVSIISKVLPTVNRERPPREQYSRGAPALRERSKFDKGGTFGAGDSDSARRQRMINRPKHNHSKVATDLFKAWFYENLAYPFPTDELKNDFADRTGLSYAQVQPQQRILHCSLQ